MATTLVRAASMSVRCLLALQAAIATRKQEIQLEQQQLEAVLAAGTAAGVDPFGQPDIQPAIKV